MFAPTLGGAAAVARLKAPARVALALRHALALRIAYDGRRFDAYARNPEARTVEGCLIEALRPEGYVEDTFRTGSRTDAGVSALENVCRVIVDRKHLRGLVPAVQRNVPDGLWITAAAPVDETWNPRHAHTRIYRYVALPRGEDLPRMQEACQAFVGTHDMRAFAKVEEGRRPQRTIRAFTVGSEEGLWVFRTTSDGYLWNQVRRMVGAVVAVGRGEAAPQDIVASLWSGVPHGAFRLASPSGLLLESVQYNDLGWLPEAGRLGPQRVPHVVQEANVGVALARHMQQLAPWPQRTGRKGNG